MVAAAEALAAGGARAVLGITGTPGAGKSRLAESLVAELNRLHGAGWAAHMPMDGYHLADVQLERLGRRSRKGAPDTFDAAGFAATLHRVAAGEPDVYVPGFERDLEQPIAAALVVTAAARLVVTEGNYLLLDDPSWTAVRSALDEVWYVEGEESVRLARLVERHIEYGKAADHAASWVATTDEPNARVIEASRGRADRIVHNGADGWSFAAA